MEKTVSEDVVDKIMKNKSLYSKIVRLWAVSMLNYRKPLGDKAWKKMIDLTNEDVSNAIAFLTGFSMCGSSNAEKLRKLVPELGEV